MGYTHKKFLKSESGIFGCSNCKTHLAALNQVESHVCISVVFSF